MEPLISIPRTALAELLRASGSSLTPEQYVVSLSVSDENTMYKRYPGRAKAAAWSKHIILLAAVLSGIWACLPFGFDVEGVIIAIGLATVTFFEYRVQRYFRERNSAAPQLGFRNQAGFAVGILIYGLYHYYLWTLTKVQLPTEYNNLDADTTSLIRNIFQIFYLTVGILGCVSQFGLAWYYRAARLPVQS